MLEPDPNEATAAYMQTLIHTVNGSLFPDTDPNATTGPPSGVVTVVPVLRQLSNFTLRGITRGAGGTVHQPVPQQPW